MAKTYNLVGWEDGEVLTKAHVTIDGTDYEVTPEEVQGTTPVTAENLRHMDEAIKDLYDGGASTTDIVIGPEEPTTEDWKIWIDTDEIGNLGSEVVDTLSGNETDKAPSVRAVNEVNKYSTEETFTGKYWIDGKPIYRKVVEFGSDTTQKILSITGKIDKFTFIDAYAKGENNLKHGLYRVDDNDQFRYYINTDNTICFQTGSNFPSLPYTAYVIAEYTKTTD